VVVADNLACVEKVVGIQNLMRLHKPHQCPHIVLLAVACMAGHHTQLAVRQHHSLTQTAVHNHQLKVPGSHPFHHMGPLERLCHQH
jgi:hypothetical protein